MPARTRTPREVADAIAEDVRTLNYLTGAGSEPVALDYPADLYEVVAGLKIAAQRLPQLLGQMGAWLQDEHASGRVAHDAGQDPGQYVAAVADALQRASDDAVALAAALDSAHEACGSLKYQER